MKKTFAHHVPSEESLNKIRKLRSIFSELHELIENLAPQSRERSVALTELETTAMWAIKAIAVNDPKAEVVI